MPRQSLVRHSLTLIKNCSAFGKPEAFRKGGGKAEIAVMLRDANRATTDA